jgi:hypothetical protein
MGAVGSIVQQNRCQCDHVCMARGWESKSVEAQQEAAAERRAKPAAITADESARLAARATLSLARTRALADLQRACAPAHRAMLEQAIADLDRRLAELENPKTQIPDPTQ